MKGFLNNLLDRHRGTADIVHPRPRLRFEQSASASRTVTTTLGDELETHTYSHGIKDSSDAFVDRTSKRHTNLASSDSLTSAQQQIFRPVEQQRMEAKTRDDQLHKESEKHTDTSGSQMSRNQANLAFIGPRLSENKPILAQGEKPQSERDARHNHVSDLATNHQGLRDELARMLGRLHVPQSPEATLPLPSIFESRNQDEKTESHPIKENAFSPTPNFIREADLSQRIQTILRGLQNHTTPQASEQIGADESTRLSANSTQLLFDVEGTRVPDEEHKMQLFPSAASDLQHFDTKHLENEPTSGPSREQPGVLQIPAWLIDMQKNLDNRWREINPKPAPEPVVNVTIGRVEVRATQGETVRQSKPQKKPTGVMSLDDYLSQREYGGQA